MSSINIYHGSTNIIKKPQYGVGKSYNDYGQAFYCTDDIELAREWACKTPAGGYVNSYQINLSELSILDFRNSEYSVLHWISVLTANRSFSLNSEIARRGYDYIQEYFGVDYQDYDVLIGHRADDSYFAFAQAFLKNTITLQQLSRAITLGNLGIQYAIRSEKAFDKIKFISGESVDGSKYFSLRSNRDDKARADYQSLKANIDIDGIYLIDIIRNKWGADDVRI